MKTEFDVIVAGGGLSGVAAAVAAAREGMDVLLIEKNGCLGGAACHNLVNPFPVYWRKTGDTIEPLNQGIFQQILDGLAEMGAIGAEGQFFHEEYLKIVLDRLTAKFHVKVLLHSLLVSVEKTADSVRSISVANKGGVTLYRAKYFIDATGDADLAAFAGFPYSVGEAETGRCQPMTLCFNVGNVQFGSMSYFEVRKAVVDLYRDWRARGKIKNPREDVLIFKSLLPGVLHFNSTRIINKNPLDPEDLTAAEQEAREQMLELFAFLKDNFAMFKDSYIINSAHTVGVRESRRINGLYTLTAEDLMNCVHFEDSIARGNYPIDIHSPTGGGTILQKIPQDGYYTIPLRSLIPNRSKNLLVTGRCISATHEAQASIRVMPIMCCVGEGAGIAASVAVSGACTAAEADSKQIQSILTKHGGLF